MTLTVLLFALCRVLDKKMDAAFCATTVLEEVSGGMNIGRLNRLTRKMINRRKGGKKAEAKA